MSKIRIRTAADIRAIEAGGLEAFLPDATPYAILERSAARTPDATALLYLSAVDRSHSDLRLSYAALLRQVRQAANLFLRLGVGPADSVVLLMPHVPAGQIALWGAEAAGRACPINPMLRPDHIIALIRAAGARVAVVQGSNGDLDIWDRIVPALRAAGCLTHILHADADQGAQTTGSDGSFEALLDKENGAGLDFPRVTDPDAVAAFFHTGGTTGAPKLALHTHRNQAFVAAGAAAMYDLEPHDVVVNGFPLFHVAGAFVYGLSVLAAGGTILIPTRLGMRNRAFVISIWRQVERYGITALGGVPTVISALNGVALDADIAILRVMLTGGSPLPAELADAFERRFAKPVRNILGMTECAGVVTIEPFHGPRTPGSTGLRLPFTEVAAFRASTSGADLTAPCTPGETGIIALRGPNVGPGYSDAARNPGTFEAGGWLVSGDLGHVDWEGRVYITGRAKDVIIRGAHNIDPATIEDALMQHPAVALAAAVGQPDAYAGELPVAFVTLKSGVTANPELLKDFLAEQVPEPAAAPKRVFVLAEMPMTAIGKVYKPALRVIATRAAIEAAVTRLGLPAGTFAIDVTEAGCTVRLASLADAERVRGALVGMPIACAISVGPAIAAP